MTLSSGQRLGPHEILLPLGAGGMGEVYQARDTRLDRNVAIKVLPAEFSANASLKARFEREARAISALNHPNICTLHDVGHENGLDYLVMEYIEGEALVDRLRKGPLPLEQVLRYGVQIASALDAAHRQGIIHRDLKPGNVMLTKAGAKLLDFGLAKESPYRSALISGGTEMPTQQKALTAEGTMIGTFQYMAPEQLEGGDADARTDIFALGTLLYEMTTGVRAFDGRTRTSIIAAIVSSQPAPISTFQPMTPPALEHVVRRCMAKDPDDRWQSAADIASQLQWISEAGSQVAPVAVRRRRTLNRYLLPAAALLAGLLAATAFWSLRDPSSVPAISHFDIAAPAGKPFVLTARRAFAVSPDESTIAYTGRTGQGGTLALFIRRSGGFDTVEIEGSSTPGDVAFSPDGRWIAFHSRGKVKKVSLDGGKPIDLCDASSGSTSGMHWAGERILFNMGFVHGIWSVPAAGGEKTLLFAHDPSKKEGAVLYPQLLPDGKHVLHTIWRGGSFDDADIAVRSLESGEQKIVMRGGSDARYFPSGHLIYGRAGALLAVPFDVSRLEVKGAPVLVLDDVATGTTNGEAHFALSERGTLLYAAGGVVSEDRDLVWVDREGNATPVVPTRRPYNNPRLSPDGQMIATTIETSNYDIWVLDVDRDAMNRISFGADDAEPLWSPDGRRIAWTSSRTGHQQVFIRDADGSGVEQQLTNEPGSTYMTSWAPDGTISLRRRHPQTSRMNSWLLSPDQKPRPFREPDFNEIMIFSPDGNWIILSSDESGRGEVYVTAYPGPGPKVKVSTDGGGYARWSRDGSEIFYRQGDKLFAVPFDPSRTVSVGRPTLLFEGAFGEDYDVAPDGRFLMVRFDPNHRTVTNLRVVSGWSDELRRRVPAN
ncbi:MAG TPA: protein kinase [Thermoanaerobaculia bacterium]